MDKVKITINGKEYEVNSSMTILEACRSVGINDIPTLCHDERLKPYGSCFMCVVRVEGKPNLVPSCATPVADGMKIITDSEEIRSARKTALELLLSNHYADCIAPCKLTCPSNVDVQGYIAFIAAQQPHEAVRLIKETNPLPAICGRVCTRPCEDACRRNLVDERVGIDYLKRYASDKDEASGSPYHAPKPKEILDKKIAVVGAGPAGLTCAYYLAQKGYQVEIFEEKPSHGGMTRYGIPQYRLPADVIDTEVSRITELGVKIHYNKALERDFTLAELKKNYDAVFIGIGCQKNRPMGIEGEDTIEGFLSGIEFLENIERGNIKDIKGRVIVVGGGNTAIDCARSSVRLGADEVTILYRRTRKEMPAHDMEIEEAAKEGVKFEFLAAPVKAIADENGKLKALECIRMELGEPDASGRRRPVPIPGSEFQIECDWAIAAIGQIMDDSVIEKEPEELKPKLNRWRTFDVDPETGATNVEGVFAGGDDVTGPATVIEAIAAGKKAAYAIDKYIQTGKPEPMPWEFVSHKDLWNSPPPGEEFEHYEHIPKQKMPEAPVEERIKDFREVELGFTDEQAMIEASRCLECGCSSVYTCDLKRYATEYEADPENYVGEVKKYEVDNRHPFIRIDMNKCILCARCIRMCSDEVVGENVLGFVNRGFDTMMRPELQKPLLETSCISCGMCVATCPTGALESKTYTPKPGPWELDYVPTTCGYCSAGCELMVGKVADLLVQVDISQRGFACFNGRYGAGYVISDDRIKKPLVDGNRVSLDEALAAVEKALAGVDKSMVAVFVAPNLTCEEMSVAKDIAAAIGTNLIGSLEQVADFQTPGLEFSTANYDDIKNADVILLVDGDIKQTHPTIAFRINNAVYNGARLLYIGAKKTNYRRTAEVFLQVPEGGITPALWSLAAGEIETVAGKLEVDPQTLSAVAEALSGAEKPVIVYAAGGTEFAGEGDRALLGNIAAKFGAKVLFATGSANTFGAKAVFGDVSALRDAVKNRQISAIIALGDDPLGWKPKLFEGIPVIAAMDVLPTETTESARVVLPLATFEEIEGTYLSTDLMPRKLGKAFEPRSGYDNLTILSALCEKLGGTTKDYSSTNWLELVPQPKAEYPIKEEWAEIQPKAEPVPMTSRDRYVKNLKAEKLGK